AQRFSVTLVALKAHPAERLPALDTSVTLHSLALSPGWLSKLKAYRALLSDAYSQSGHRPTSISLCFSADMLNAACKRHARIISSVRSNLLKDYRMGFGWP